MGGWVGDITCIFFVPMSTIDDSWLYFVIPPVPRGRCAQLQPSRGALIGCARNRGGWAILWVFSFDVSHAYPPQWGSQKLPLTTHASWLNKYVNYVDT